MSEPTHKVQIYLVVGLYEADTPHSYWQVGDAWDEYSLEANPSGLDEAVAKLKAGDADEVATFGIEVDQDVIDRRFERAVSAGYAEIKGDS